MELESAIAGPDEVRRFQAVRRQEGVSSRRNFSRL
jgi:hypothetical protein